MPNRDSLRSWQCLIFIQKIKVGRKEGRKINFMSNVFLIIDKNSRGLIRPPNSNESYLSFRCLRNT